jgi:hypothetical protein
MPEIALAPETTRQAIAAPARAPARQARRKRRNHGWYRLISPVAVVALWQLESTASLVPKDKLPPPSTIWHTHPHTTRARTTPALLRAPRHPHPLTVSIAQLSPLERVSAHSAR